MVEMLLEMGNGFEPLQAVLLGAVLLVVLLSAVTGVVTARWRRATRATAAAEAALDALEKVQRARRQTEERFRSLVLNTSDVITILTADGCIDFYSPSATRIWGYSADGLRAASLLTLVHVADVEVARG